MDLGERKKLILQAIIEDYITTAEPVGSKTVVLRHDLGLSSATVRNEMADLEEMGFLDKPHTSAGRIPSETGYRFYVDSLMRKYDPSEEELSRIDLEAEPKASDPRAMIAEISEAISQITSYTALVELPAASESRLKSIKFIPMEEGLALAVMVTDDGRVRTQKLKVDCGGAQDAERFFECLAGELAGFLPDDFTTEKMLSLLDGAGSREDLLKNIFSIALDTLASYGDEVYIGGAANIFNHPEFRDIDRARSLLSFIDRRENMHRVLGLTDREEGFGIRIGSESGIEPMRGASVVIANYRVGKLRGRIGIIGPTRMHYARVISSLERINDRLEKMLFEMFYGGD